MAFIYILFSKSKNKFYTGSTHEDSSEKRLQAHNFSKTRSTKAGIPWKVIYEEKYLNYTEARKRELFLKTGVGRAWIKKEFGYLK
ncbi:hypothetical protein MNBD_UNCLBAC01-1613 [hydrothermal vent metagenome]|uniref:GIY-YIG domain-containing protein n=1 Tax=hydrothermal vent metagenome TaxID=652676 RepID=A0A3B1DM00_9ZZZZ